MPVCCRSYRASLLRWIIPLPLTQPDRKRSWVTHCCLSGGGDNLNNLIEIVGKRVEPGIFIADSCVGVSQ